MNTKFEGSHLLILLLYIGSGSHAVLLVSQESAKLILSQMSRIDLAITLLLVAAAIHSIGMASSCLAGAKPLRTDVAVFLKLTVVPLLLVSLPIFMTIPEERRRIAEPLTNYPQTTHVVLEPRAIIIVASIRPRVRASHVSLLASLRTKNEIDDHGNIFRDEHDVRRIDTVMDDADGMEVLNLSFNLLKVPLCIDRSRVMIDALDQGLVVPGEAETCNAASFNNAAVVGSYVWMLMFHENLRDPSFSRHDFAQISWHF